ncbi:hypothetical protein KCU92_g162, partial [Aureobasidium melanogenum]
MTLRRNTTPFVLLFIAFFWRHAIPSFKKARRFSFVTQQSVAVDAVCKVVPKGGARLAQEVERKCWNKDGK